MWPHVTVCTLTHARSKLLAQCVRSVQRLRYPGSFDHLIVNDCPEQRLTINTPGVTIANYPEVFSTIGAKRNEAMRLARGEWIAWVDDDDQLMPGHLTKIRQAVDAGLPLLGSTQTLWFCGDKGEVTGPACMDALMERKSALDIGFPDKDVGEDWWFMKEMVKKFGKVDDSSLNPTYIQCWGNGAYHVSGQGEKPDAASRFRANALDLLRDGREPSGEVPLVWEDGIDYAALSYGIINAWHKNRAGSSAP